MKHDLGTGHGGARIDQSGCRRADGAERHASAFGIFTAGYGLAWFLGSAAIGVLYNVSLAGVVVFCILAQLAAVRIFHWVERSMADES